MKRRCGRGWRWLGGAWIGAAGLLATSCGEDIEPLRWEDFHRQRDEMVCLILRQCDMSQEPMRDCTKDFSPDAWEKAVCDWRSELFDECLAETELILDSGTCPYMSPDVCSRAESCGIPLLSRPSRPRRR